MYGLNFCQRHTHHKDPAKTDLCILWLTEFSHAVLMQREYIE